MEQELNKELKKGYRIANKQYRVHLDKKYKTCITSSIHLFINGILENNEPFKVFFNKIHSNKAIQQVSEMLLDEYVKTHKYSRIIQKEDKDYVNPMLLELLYTKLSKINEK